MAAGSVVPLLSHSKRAPKGILLQGKKSHIQKHKSAYFVLFQDKAGAAAPRKHPGVVVTGKRVGASCAESHFQEKGDVFKAQGIRRRWHWAALGHGVRTVSWEGAWLRGSRDSAAEKLLSGSPWPLPPRPPWCPRPRRPLQGETRLPSRHGGQAGGLRRSPLAAPVLQPPRAIDVAQRPADGAALGGVQGQQAAQHQGGLGRQALPVAGQVLLQARLLPQHEVLKERVIWQALLPGEVASQQAEKQHPEGPGVQAGVDGHALGVGGVAQLRGGVGDHPGHQLELGAPGPREPKVGQLDAPALGVEKQHVLRLDVAVHEPSAVDELQRADELRGAVLGGWLGDPVLRRERGRRWGKRRQP